MQTFSGICPAFSGFPRGQCWHCWVFDVCFGSNESVGLLLNTDFDVPHSRTARDLPRQHLQASNQSVSLNIFHPLFKFCGHCFVTFIFYASDRHNFFTHVMCHVPFFLVFGESETTNLKCGEKSLMKWVPDYSNRELSCDRLAAWWGIGTTGPTSESVLPDHIACVGNIVLHHEIILIESSGSWKRLFNCTGSEKWFYFRIERRQIVFLSYRCIANILCCTITDLKQNLTGHLDPMMTSE